MNVTFDRLIKKPLMHGHAAGDITGLSLDGYVDITGDTMTGALVITPTADGTSILNVTQADTTSILNVDTTNQEVTINATTTVGDSSGTRVEVDIVNHKVKIYVNNQIIQEWG